VLVNALYFRARWQEEFMPEMTRARRFWLGDSDSAQAATMEIESRFALGKRQTGAVLELPYRGGPYSMYVLLPHDRNGVGKMEEECLREQLDACLGHLEQAYVKLRLPRFRIETDSMSLRPMLRTIGMTSAFDATRADFGAMTDAAQRLFISDIAQKVYVAVDEKGTEAAASTVVVSGDGDIPPPPIPFFVDHPFVFLIRDRKSGAVLFVGRVKDPRE
jgi:serpin B